VILESELWYSFIRSTRSPLPAASIVFEKCVKRRIGDNSDMIMLHMKECGILSSSGAAGRRACASSSRVQAGTSLQMEDTSGVHFTNGIDRIQ
jgi:hypothetical protein